MKWARPNLCSSIYGMANGISSISCILDRVAQKQAVPIMKILQKKKELAFWLHDKLKNTWTSQLKYM